MGFHFIKRFASDQKILFWFFLAMLILPNVMMFFTESTGVLTRIVSIVLPLGFYWTAMTFHSKPGKMFWWLFIFIFFAAFQIVLLRLFGESPIAVDMFLNVMTTNVSEAGELLLNLMMAVTFVVVLYGSGIVLAIISCRNQEKLGKVFLVRQRIYGALLLVFGTGLLTLNYVVDRRFALLDDIYPANVCYNLALAIDRSIDSGRYKESCKDFTYNATSTHDDSTEVYVLVIEETLRADNMSLYGYNRPTTPELQRMGDELVPFSDAITMSNTTHKSVPLLLTPIASEQWDSLYHRKGIITAFAEAGYQTAFYSNQRRNHSFIDFLGGEAQEVKFVKDSVPLDANINDSVLVDLLREKLNRHQEGKLFVVMHFYGCHFNYHDRYEPANAVFKPDDTKEVEKRHRQIMVNAYDNAVMQADRLMAQIIDLLRNRHVPAALLMTSDHGEDIFDDYRNRFLHASPLPTYYQLRVPLLAWTSQEYGEKHPTKHALLQAHRNEPVSTNLVVFHTMLDLAGISTAYLRPEHALDNERFRAGKRYYVNDHNEYRTLDDCGLKPIDFDKYQSVFHQQLK